MSSVTQISSAHARRTAKVCDDPWLKRGELGAFVLVMV
jgi:hypothetical protein